MKKLEKSILFSGEVTGHVHVLDDSNVDVYEQDDGTKTFKIEKPTKLVHQEHKAITISVGDFVSDKVVEQDHFAGEARKVVD